jgi:hypothetical protein
LRLVPVEVRGAVVDIVVGAVRVVVKGVDVTGRLEVVIGRFGGTPRWRGGVVFSFPGSVACSPPDVTPGATSSGAGEETGASTSVPSMVANVPIISTSRKRIDTQISDCRRCVQQGTTGFDGSEMRRLKSAVDRKISRCG